MLHVVSFDLSTNKVKRFNSVLNIEHDIKNTWLKIWLAIKEQSAKKERHMAKGVAPWGSRVFSQKKVENYSNWFFNYEFQRPVV